jgi:hypothetical protein
MPSPHEESHRQHAGDQVGESLALVRSFAETGSPGGDDLLGSREEAVRWLRKEGLLASDAVLSNSEHTALVRLRRALQDVLAAHADGREDEDATTRLTKGLADGRLVVTIGAGATVELTTAARASYPTVVATLAVSIARAAAAGRWPER